MTHVTKTMSAAGLAAGAMLLVAASAGCGGGGKLMKLETSAEFDQHVLRADRPALVDFYKGGCPTCVVLEPTLNKLHDEYEGRVTFASFELMKPYFAVTERDLKERYDVKFYPTVVLFVGGEEKERFVLDYDIQDYREALDAALEGPAAEKTPAGPEGAPGAP